METRANYVIVGIFTVATVLAAFGFVYWTAGLGDRAETAMLRFRIPTSRGSISMSRTRQLRLPTPSSTGLRRSHARPRRMSGLRA